MLSATASPASLGPTTTVAITTTAAAAAVPLVSPFPSPHVAPVRVVAAVSMTIGQREEINYLFWFFVVETMPLLQHGAHEVARAAEVGGVSTSRTDNLFPLDIDLSWEIDP